MVIARGAERAVLRGCPEHMVPLPHVPGQAGGEADGERQEQVVDLIVQLGRLEQLEADGAVPEQARGQVQGQGRSGAEQEEACPTRLLEQQKLGQVAHIEGGQSGQDKSRGGRDQPPARGANDQYHPADDHRGTEKEEVVLGHHPGSEGNTEQNARPPALEGTNLLESDERPDHRRDQRDVQQVELAQLDHLPVHQGQQEAEDPGRPAAVHTTEGIAPQAERDQEQRDRELGSLPARIHQEEQEVGHEVDQGRVRGIEN